MRYPDSLMVNSNVIDLGVLQRFNEREIKASRDKLEQLWTRPIKERVKARKAIEAVRFSELFTVVDYADTYFIRGHVKENNSDFKEGESVRIHRGNPRYVEARGQIYSVDTGGDLLIGFSGYELKNAQNLDSLTSYCVDKDEINMQKIYDAALLREQENPYRDLHLSLLNQRLKPQYRHMSNAEIESIVAMDRGLNPAQYDAVIKAVSCSVVHLIQGPPGTGKTHVLGLIACYLAQQKKERVLITAPTHLAINNALVKCVKLGFPQTHITKVGQRYNRDGLTISDYSVLCKERLSEFEFMLDEGTITGISPFHLHTARAKNLEFDTVIIDEAGQMNIAVALMAMTCAKRCILVGDHQQMAPIFSSDEHPVLLRKSIFELLFDYYGGTMLDITYRMNELVCDFPSKTYYADKLKPFEKHVGRRLSLSCSSSDRLLSEEAGMVWLPMPDSAATVCNPLEGDCVVETIVRYIAAGISIDDIAVVTPFKAQARYIKKNLAVRLSLSQEVSKQLVVDTVERMQGQEREVIIVSMASGSPAFVKEIADFFYQPNRMNVAVTRAKNKVLLFASTALLELHSEDEKIEGWMRTFDALFHAAKCIAPTEVFDFEALR